MKALTKKNDITSVGLVSKKIKISGDKVKVFKEKKSARESFVCGACGQLGHMRTNKTGNMKNMDFRVRWAGDAHPQNPFLFPREYTPHNLNYGLTFFLL